jgi:hypothetical protein
MCHYGTYAYCRWDAFLENSSWKNPANTSVTKPSLLAEEKYIKKEA